MLTVPPLICCHLPHAIHESNGEGRDGLWHQASCVATCGGTPITEYVLCIAAHCALAGAGRTDETKSHAGLLPLNQLPPTWRSKEQMKAMLVDMRVCSLSYLKVLTSAACQRVNTYPGRSDWEQITL